ncbi:hypothetical protein MRS76_09030 [Rhizobiaceae bacterium n13]|uniref:Uncharacterized protein n=1 Tax=Ferirhizobium litorale TaxID=2927786 RepID=A0AAE3U104_9HYPH|nr:hypothetical protein [Fererhizobium litorale]MDI7862099.1 hypothetical protein [Fererhizobium litorale]MDI7922629.1 hypothetical protein [Fererhizobium litorale]
MRGFEGKAGKVVSRPIVLLFTGHVGSSWLTDLIGRHQEINHIGFEPIDALSKRNTDAHPWVERLAQGGDPTLFPREIRRAFSSRYHAGAPYFIFKTRARVKHQPTLFYETIPSLNSYVILLRRRNKLKTAVSSYKRNTLKISHLDNPKANADKRVAIHVDPAQILAIAESYIRRETKTKRLFDRYKSDYGLDGMEVLYEDILHPPGLGELMRTLSAELGIPSFESESRFTKMTENDLQLAIANFDELANQVSGTSFEKFLFDDDYDPVAEKSKWIRWPLVPTRRFFSFWK